MDSIPKRSPSKALLRLVPPSLCESLPLAIAPDHPASQPWAWLTDVPPPIDGYATGFALQTPSLFLWGRFCWYLATVFVKSKIRGQRLEGSMLISISRT